MPPESEIIVPCVRSYSEGSMGKMRMESEVA
jgi:hypothetical protein